jgi:hypothetical protein
MASTYPENVVPLREGWDHRQPPSAPWNQAVEADHEAAALAADVARRARAAAERRARRRAAWGMPPALAYALLVLTAAIYLAIGLVVHGITSSYDDRPDVVTEQPAPTTTTGTLPPEIQP